MIMPEIHRENRRRAATAQRKTCQTVKKPDINNNSLLPGPENCESGPREFSALCGLFVASPFIWYFSWLRPDVKAGAGTKVLLALPELELRRSAACQD